MVTLAIYRTTHKNRLELRVRTCLQVNIQNLHPSSNQTELLNKQVYSV